MISNKLPQIRQVLRSGSLKTQLFFQRVWFKILILFLIAFIFTRKDLSFQVNLKASEFQNQKYLPASVSFQPKEISENKIKKKKEINLLKETVNTPPGETENLPEKKPKNNSNRMSLVDLNLANPATATSSALTEAEKIKAKKLSNLTFVMNPNYAKKHNISKAIVNYKIAICENYVKRFSGVAKSEMEKFGIPASIILAQGLLESNAGDSYLSRKANNHFGMKCFSRNCKKGHCVNATDDSHKDFFRSYETAWESYRAHSMLLEGKRYRHLSKLGTKNYKDWAHGLKKAGYATDKKYAEKLILLIENMKLDKYDQ